MDLRDDLARLRPESGDGDERCVFERWGQRMVDFIDYHIKICEGIEVSVCGDVVLIATRD